MRNEQYISFLKYSLLFGLGILISIYLMDSNAGLSRLIFLLSISLYALIVVGEIFASAKRVKQRNIGLGYDYESEIQSLKDELDILEKGIRSNYMLYYLRNLLYERLKIKYGIVNFEKYESLKEVINDDLILRLLTDKDFSISNLDEVEEILARIERCCR